MDTKIELKEGVDERLVYVRPVDTQDLPTEVQGQVEGIKTIYAVHDEDGQRLALVKDREMAFALARQHDMAPVTVH